MKTNKYGIRGLKSAHVQGKLRYFWTPPKSLQKTGIFQYKYLGGNFEIAVRKARDWNAKLEMHRVAVNGIKPTLTTIEPGTVGYLVRQFEASPRFARYAFRTRQDYSWMYRDVEAQYIEGDRMLGEMKISEITNQVAYKIYEENIKLHGYDSANKYMGAWHAAFRYGMFKFGEITANPFSNLEKFPSPPRRQRWTDQHLNSFIKKPNELGYPSVGRCALMCMELMQRPGDILSLKWDAYDNQEKIWHMRQSKRGAIVRIPETHRLRTALNPLRRSIRKLNQAQRNETLVCGTVTGKRWHRRNFTKTVRRIARAAGLPDDLQVRDLRRTAATEGACAGATPAEMMAVGGWASQASFIAPIRDSKVLLTAQGEWIPTLRLRNTLYRSARIVLRTMGSPRNDQRLFEATSATRGNTRLGGSTYQLGGSPSDACRRFFRGKRHLNRSLWVGSRSG